MISYKETVLNCIIICTCVEIDMIGNAISNMGIVSYILVMAYNV